MRSSGLHLDGHRKGRPSIVLMVAIYLSLISYVTMNLIFALVSAGLFLWIMINGNIFEVYKRAHSSVRIGIALLLLSSLLILPFTLTKGMIYIAHYFTLVATVIISMICSVKYPTQYYRALQSLLYFYIVIVLGVIYFSDDTFPLECLVDGFSSNGVTSYLLIIQISYIISKFILYKEIAWVTPVITLYICYVGYGRGSLITALAVVCVCVLMWIIQLKQGLVKTAVKSVLVFLLAFVLLEQFGALDALRDNTKLASGLNDSHRETIIEDYVSQITPLTAMTGGSYSETVIEREYNGNPHNSYIRAHFLFGIPYLAAIFITVLLPLLHQGLPQAKLFVFSLVGLMAFRAYTEPILFPTPLDIFFLTSVFMTLCDNIQINYSNKNIGRPRISTDPLNG